MKRYHLFLLIALLLPLQLMAGDPVVEQRLKSLPGISDVQPLESDVCNNKFVMYITQQVNPHDPAAGTFRQRVILCHVGFDRPTVLVTEGYYAHYALRPSYQDEVARLLNANTITVEYRYFAKSVPEPCNWDYLTVENSLFDLHHVNQTFHALYPGKWVATGISKGGQTTMFYRAFFPNDVDVSVPYVAPLNRSTEDGRHQPFLEKTVGTKAERDSFKAFQTEVLKRKQALLPLLTDYCQKKAYAFRVPLTDIFDYLVLEYPFALWQWGTPVSKIPSLAAPDSVLFKHFVRISEPGYFTPNNPSTPFFVQAARELGYYGYDMEPFRQWMSINTTHDYLHRIMLGPEFAQVRFDDTLYRKTLDFLKRQDPKMIYIYGGDDPWSASGVEGLPFLKKKKNIKVYVLPKGSHRTRINSFPEPRRSEIIHQLKSWLQE